MWKILTNNWIIGSLKILAVAHSQELDEDKHEHRYSQRLNIGHTTKQVYEYRNSLEILCDSKFIWTLLTCEPAFTHGCGGHRLSSSEIFCQTDATLVAFWGTRGRSVAAGAETSCVHPNHSNWTCLWVLGDCLSLKQTLNMKPGRNLRRIQRGN